MLITPSRQNLIEKILRNNDGRLVRATFCVYENHGRVKARLVKAVFLDEQVALTGSVKTSHIFGHIFALPGFVSTGPIISASLVSTRSTPSPYFKTDLLYVSGSQPRAPTFL